MARASLVVSLLAGVAVVAAIAGAVAQHDGRLRPASSPYEDSLSLVSEFRPVPSDGSRLIHVLDVAVEGSRAYCSGYGGVSAFDISDVASPIHLGNYNPRRSREGEFYHRLAAGDGVVYVARRWGGIDVVDFSEETRPVLAGTYRLNDAASYESLHVWRQTLYAAAHTHGVEVLDLGDPPSPRHVRLIPTRNAFGVSRTGQRLLVADGKHGLAVIDLSEPGNATEIARVPTSGTAQHIVESGNHAYVAVGAAGFDIIDVSEPAHPCFLGNYATLGFCSHLAVLDDRAFSAEWSGIEVVDVSRPAQPQLLAHEPTRAQSMGIAAAGDFVYVADWSHVRAYRFEQHDAPDIHVDADFLSFGAFESHEELRLVAQNIGREELAIESMESDNRAIHVVDRQFVVPPGGAQPITLFLEPTAARSIRASITVHSNDPDQPHYSLPVFAGTEVLGPGDTAPDFTLPTYDDGETVTLSALEGQRVVFTCFASW